MLSNNSARTFLTGILNGCVGVHSKAIAVDGKILVETESCLAVNQIIGLLVLSQLFLSARPVAFRASIMPFNRGLVMGTFSTSSSKESSLSNMYEHSALGQPASSWTRSRSFRVIPKSKANWPASVGDLALRLLLSFLAGLSLPSLNAFLFVAVVVGKA